MNAHSPVRTYVRVWLALLLLLAATVASAYVHLGVGNLITNVGIAIVKALLVMLFFMHVRTGGTTIRLMAATGFLWLILLLTLSLADVLTRSPVRPPW
jgi:cytochrome c oxidase subunit 4